MKTEHYIIPSRLLAIFFSITSLLGVVTLNMAACAEAAMLKSQDKGGYRMMVGDFEVTVLSDGTNKQPIEQQLQLLQGDKEQIKKILMHT